MEFPQELRYTKDHEWARLENGKVTIGVTAFAVEQLGDITQVDLPDVNRVVKAGEACGTIESVKSVSDIYAPIAGKVTRINETLEDSPELVNESCYGKGWMIEIAPTGNEFAPHRGASAGGEQSEFASLLDSAAYAALVAESH